MRVAGVEIPKDKNIEISLTYLYGIGRSSSRKVLSEVGIDPLKRTRDLTSEEENKVRRFIDANYKIEADLTREVVTNIRRLESINCYRGIRHRKRLPVRGQRTRSNARTMKGPRKGAITKKK